LLRIVQQGSVRVWVRGPQTLGTIVRIRLKNCPPQGRERMPQPKTPRVTSAKNRGPWDHP
jgi:hypothetical protein